MISSRNAKIPKQQIPYRPSSQHVSPFRAPNLFGLPISPKEDTTYNTYSDSVLQHPELESLKASPGSAKTRGRSPIVPCYGAACLASRLPGTASVNLCRGVEHVKVLVVFITCVPKTESRFRLAIDPHHAYKNS